MSSRSSDSRRTPRSHIEPGARSRTRNPTAQEVAYAEDSVRRTAAQFGTTPAELIAPLIAAYNQTGEIIPVDDLAAALEIVIRQTVMQTDAAAELLGQAMRVDSRLATITGFAPERLGLAPRSAVTIDDLVARVVRYLLQTPVYMNFHPDRGAAAIYAADPTVRAIACSVGLVDTLTFLAEWMVAIGTVAHGNTLILTNPRGHYHMMSTAVQIFNTVLHARHAGEVRRPSLTPAQQLTVAQIFEGAFTWVVLHEQAHLLLGDAHRLAGAPPWYNELLGDEVATRCLCRLDGLTVIGGLLMVHVIFHIEARFEGEADDRNSHPPPALRFGQFAQIHEEIVGQRVPYYDLIAVPSAWLAEEYFVNRTQALVHGRVKALFESDSPLFSEARTQLSDDVIRELAQRSVSFLPPSQEHLTTFRTAENGESAQAVFVSTTNLTSILLGAGGSFPFATNPLQIGLVVLSIIFAIAGNSTKLDDDAAAVLGIAVRKPGASHALSELEQQFAEARGLAAPEAAAAFARGLGALSSLGIVRVTGGQLRVVDFVLHVAV